MSDYDMSIHDNSDAAAWAKFFMETKTKNNWSLDDIDEDLMLGWFANAMMAMHDHVLRQHLQEKNDIRVSMLQYKSLRAHFNKMVTAVLGEDYYNLAMDVYDADRICCEDIVKKVKHTK